MKRTIMLVLLIGTFSASQAQGIGEWFNQKKTQTKYLLQQIAALQVYKEYLEKGYGIAKTGLGAISDFKDGEYKLHGLFFNSLKAVNPKIKKYKKIPDIIAMQTNIISVYSKTIRQVRESRAYGNGEREYVSRVYKRLLDDCEEAIGELIDIITDGSFEMRDDERIERLDALYLRVRDMYVFSRHFGDEALQLGASKLRDEIELGLYKEWLEDY